MKLSTENNIIVDWGPWRFINLVLIECAILVRWVASCKTMEKLKSRRGNWSTRMKGQKPRHVYLAEPGRNLTWVREVGIRDWQATYWSVRLTSTALLPYCSTRSESTFMCFFWDNNRHFLFLLLSQNPRIMPIKTWLEYFFCFYLSENEPG